METIKNIIYVKAGPHAGQSLSKILERKHKELSAPMKLMFWGYATTTTRPKEVIEFVSKNHTKGELTYLIMKETSSDPDKNKASSEIEEAKFTEYSIDGKKWKKIPEGIEVTYTANVRKDGEKKAENQLEHFAFVCKTMVIRDLEIDLADYTVAAAVNKASIGERLTQHFYDIDKEKTKFGQYKRKRTQSVSAAFSKSKTGDIHIHETVCCVCELYEDMPAVYVR